MNTQQTEQDKTVKIPQPVQGPGRSRRGYAVIVIGIVLVLLLSIGAFAMVHFMPQSPQTQVTPTVVPTTQPPTPTTGNTDTTPIPAPGVVLGPQACPPGIDSVAHWNAIIGTNNGERSVERISCANILDTSTLQALVTVRHTNVNRTLDVYVFNAITTTQPTRVFLLSGLLKGDAQISGYNTILTAEVDTRSAMNVGKSVPAMTADLFREFDWSSAQGTLIQTAFPGIFPDLTRYQAEADQVRVNQGQESWKNDPVQVAQALAKQFFGWQRPLISSIVSGGGVHDVNATVKVEESPVQGAQGQGPSVLVTLSRLEGNTHNMWIAIAVNDGSMLTLENIDAGRTFTSPIRLEGIGAAFEAVIGHAIVYDHLSTDIGHAQITGDNGMGIAHYVTNVSYTSTFQQGPQEGIVAVYENNGGISDEIYTAVLRKVLLSPEPGVASGVVSCPDAVKSPDYWTSFISLPPNPGVAEQVSCGNLFGKPTVQALVVAREIVGGGPTFRSAFVFDNITASKPTLLFKISHMYQGNALISGYSTVITAEVDNNSTLNKGKADANMTQDLYREFEWSAGKGAFVQIAFPGIFPDLTRYQAEMDQRMVSNGQDQWKMDAKQVAQHLATTLLKWSPTAQATLISGGGAQNVDAVVQVRSTGPDHPMITVTLSRLEGNTYNFWLATAVSSGAAMSISTPGKWEMLTSPVTVKGTGGAFEGDVGTVFILDHLYNDIGHAKGVPVSSGITPFTATVSYTSTFHSGAQEGVLAYYRYSMADGAIAGVILQKVLIAG